MVIRIVNGRKLENTKGAIKNGQSRETGNIGHTRRRQTKQQTQHNMCWHHYMQGNIYNVNKTRALLKITGGKDEPNIAFYSEIVAGTATQNLERKNIQ